MLFPIYAAIAVAIPGVMSVTVFSDDQMNSYLNAGGVDLAYNYAPVFFFSQSQNQVPCIPTWAFSGSVSTPDIYDAAHQTKPAPQCQYPNVGCGCRNPGVPIGNQIQQFPLYYTYQKCNDNEVRVAYNLYYQKDGAIFGAIQTGHDHDWERVIIIHTRDTNANTWQPTTALYSAHSGYNKYAWGSIQNTLSTQDAEAGAGPTPNGLTGLDHPKAYVAWSKHPMYHDRNTGWNDPISQSTANAFRGQDWWRFVAKQNYIRSDRSTAAGAALGSVNWGSASSNPPSVQDSICSQGN